MGAHVIVPLPHERIIGQKFAPLRNLLSEAARVRRFFVRVPIEYLCLYLRVPLLLLLPHGLLRVHEHDLLAGGRTLTFLHQAGVVTVWVFLVAEGDAHDNARHAVEGAVDARCLKSIAARGQSDFLVRLATPQMILRARCLVRLRRIKSHVFTICQWQKLQLGDIFDHSEADGTRLTTSVDFKVDCTTRAYLEVVNLFWLDHYFLLRTGH